MPKCTVIKTGATVTKEASERAEELKKEISDIALAQLKAAKEEGF